MLPDGTVVEYVVDGRNRRVGRVVDGVLEQAWLYDGQLRIVAELDGAGNLVSRFVYAGGVNVPAYMVRDSDTYRLVTDHLGSLRMVVDVATGDIVQERSYDQWGVVLADTNPGFVPFGFAGGLYDPDTGLVRFGARDYDPEVGRWTTKDPIGFGGGTPGLFEYVGDDPVNSLDPSGRFPWAILPFLALPLVVDGGISVATFVVTGIESEFYGLPTYAGGPADAVKHCTASCRVGRYTAGGPFIARSVGLLNEVVGGNEDLDYNMDAANNECGIELIGESGSCQELCMEALHTGDLVYYGIGEAQVPPVPLTGPTHPIYH